MTREEFEALKVGDRVLWSSNEKIEIEVVNRGMFFDDISFNFRSIPQAFTDNFEITVSARDAETYERMEKKEVNDAG